jgi:DNA polymerase/3'-5' exonuclease PolX
MGVCVFQSSVHHRIDIKYYPYYQFPFAVLYFTGSEVFNRSMRLYARKLGYSLSDHGLAVVERNAGNEKIWRGGEVGVGNEEEIFGFLGLGYRRPEERDI